MILGITRPDGSKNVYATNTHSLIHSSGLIQWCREIALTRSLCTLRKMVLIRITCCHWDSTVIPGSSMSALRRVLSPKATFSCVLTDRSSVRIASWGMPCAHSQLRMSQDTAVHCPLTYRPPTTKMRSYFSVCQAESAPAQRRIVSGAIRVLPSGVMVTH